MPRLVSIASAIALILTADAAHACGGWRLSGSDRSVMFEHGYVWDARGENDRVVITISVARRWAALGRVDRPDLADRTQAIRIAGDRVMLGRRQLATIEGNRLAIDGHRFDLSVEPGAQGFEVTVSEEGRPLFSGHASAVDCNAAARDAIRTRLVLYLSWAYSDLGAT